MRFIGSKRLLLKNIEEIIHQNIKEYKNLETFCDIFSGTSVVGQHFKPSFKIISNDLLYFSYCIQSANIKLNSRPKFSKLEKEVGDVVKYLNNNLKKKGFIYKNFSPTDSNERKYLSNDNACRIDGVRIEIEKWYKNKIINLEEYLYLISIIIEATPFVSNIAGTYGAYLKNWDKRSFKKIEFIPPSIINNNKKNECYNENSNDLILNIEGDILYIDPPYNSRQYLPNYHLLETIAKYDDPILKGKTGLRNYEDQKSNYCNKSYAMDALDDLISNANFKYVLLSYNTDGIIEENNLNKLMKKYSSNIYKKTKIPYRRYKKDKNGRIDQLHELLFLISKK